jgi:NAD+ synthase (glutamine-hydrolysing)
MAIGLIEIKRKVLIMTTKTLRIALAQINTTVGDFDGNVSKIIEYTKKAKAANVDIIAFPELTIPGYPPEDLLHKDIFINKNIENLNKLTHEFDNIVAVIGFVNKKNEKIYNSAGILYNKKIIGIYNKMFLPNYSVFDEKRYFTEGSEPLVFNIDNIVFGVNICEDVWIENGPVKTQAQNGASLIININGSPFYNNKSNERIHTLQTQSKNNNIFIAYTNLIGGQDELVFDGHSMITDNNGTIIAQAKAFEEDLLIMDLNLPIKQNIKTENLINIEKIINIQEKPILPQKINLKENNKLESIYNALVLGLKDYMLKNNFNKSALGLSGGIDSALTALIAYDALGADNLLFVSMPSKYSSIEGQNDSKKISKNMDVEFLEIPIDTVFNSYLETLQPIFKDMPINTAEENLQARTRGNLLMALSNKLGYIILTTGNKSETSVGYTTLYGDTAGGFAVIKDIPKILVYKLTKYRCELENKELIPETVFTRAPSAELKDNQKDNDSLPEYEVLDEILEDYVEKDMHLSEIIKKGYDAELVKKIIRLVDRNEYKRRQSPPGIKITPKAFGKDRRMPITNKHKDY